VKPSFLAPETFADPYPLARWLRENDPVHWSTELNAWVLTRYADAAASLHDPRLAADRQPSFEQLAKTGAEALRPLYETLRRMFAFRDAPEHTRMRRAVHHAFTRRTIEGWRTEIQRLVDGLLDKVQGRSQMDLIADLALPLPLEIIRLVLGIPEEVKPRLEVWADDVAQFVGNLSHSRAELLGIQAGILEFAEYLRGLLDERRRTEGTATDLLTGLAHAPGGQLTDDEILANAIFLVVAGHTTTRDFVGNATLALLRSGGAADDVRERATEPAFLEPAIEELLRYDCPVQMTGRVARAPLEIGDKAIRPGQWVLPWFGAANHDPAQFPDPERLNLARTDNRHLAFGGSAHYCLGAPLARLQAQIALPALFSRFPRLRVADAPLVWEHRPAFRGLTSLPLLLA
jgi:cytochrome P450